MADSVTASVPMQVGDQVPQYFKEWFINDRDHVEEWRKEAQEDYDFVAGRQYTDGELKALAEKKRPVVVFNRIQPVIDSVHGQEIGNRREVRYIPREMGDAIANEMLTGAAQWFRDQSNAETHESDSFWDMLICGLGWTETRIDFEEQADGKPSIDRIDPFEMYYDFNAKGRNLTDGRRVHRVRRIPLNEAMGLFPDFTKEQLDATWTTVSNVRDLKSSAQEPVGSETSGDGLVTIVHSQWVERETYYIAQDPMTGQQSEFSEDQYNTVNERMQTLVGTQMQGVKMRRKVRKQAFFGDIVLSYGPAPCPTKFSFQAITGKRDRNKNTWYGLVKTMKDPQRWANKWLSQTMHIMNSNAKGGLLAEKGAFEDQRKAEKSWADPSAITWLENGALSTTAPRIKDKPPAQFPAGFMQLTEFALSSIRDTSGVSVEMLGLREAGQAASLEAQRRQAGLTILQPFFDALTYYRQEQGEVMLYYIQNDLSDGRLVKIEGQDNAQYVPLIKQATLEYDIIVDDAPTSPNQKEAAWAIMMQLLPIFGATLPPDIMMTLLEYSPLPATIVDKLKKQSQQMKDGQQQQQQKQQDMAEQAAAAQLEKTKSETQKNQASAQSDLMAAHVDIGTLALDASKINVDMALSGYNFIQGLENELMNGGPAPSMAQGMPTPGPMPSMQGSAQMPPPQQPPIQGQPGQQMPPPQMPPVTQQNQGQPQGLM